MKRILVSRPVLLLSAVVFLVALMVRLAVLPLQKSLERDSLSYIELAQTDLREVGELPNGAAMAKMRSRMTVFVYLLKLGPKFGLSVKCWGHILNIFAGSIAAVLIAGIALLIFQELRVAWFAGLLTAVEPVSVKYSLSLLREPLAFALAAAAILTALLWYRRKQKWFWALLSGMFSAGAALIRLELSETLVFFWLVLLLSGAFHRFSRKSIGIGLLLQMTGCILIFFAADWAIRSYDSVGICGGLRQTFFHYLSR